MDVVWAKKKCFVAIPGSNVVILVGKTLCLSVSLNTLNNSTAKSVATLKLCLQISSSISGFLGLILKQSIACYNFLSREFSITRLNITNET
jgi:hypothetical protein